jgi:hypothetical protein
MIPNNIENNHIKVAATLQELVLDCERHKQSTKNNHMDDILELIEAMIAKKQIATKSNL